MKQPNFIIVIYARYKDKRVSHAFRHEVKYQELETSWDRYDSVFLVESVSMLNVQSSERSDNT